jgi:hypothetical protein
MEDNFFKQFFEEEKRLLEELKAYDEHQKEKGEFLYRYITKGFTDRIAYYQIYSETKRKYSLKWVLGEDPFPQWGAEVRLWKKDVEKMIEGRDYFESLNKERKKYA